MMKYLEEAKESGREVNELHVFVEASGGVRKNKILCFPYDAACDLLGTRQRACHNATSERYASLLKNEAFMSAVQRTVDAVHSQPEAFNLTKEQITMVAQDSIRGAELDPAQPLPHEAQVELSNTIASVIQMLYATKKKDVYKRRPVSPPVVPEFSTDSDEIPY